ncbi:hypothetical protein ACVWW1_004619 [Bradyrhizobium sp. JR3.5]
MDLSVHLRRPEAWWLFTHLRKRRRKRRRRRMRDGRGQLTHRRNWTERPAVVEQRSRIGDWELDTIDNSHCKAVVVTMTERRSGLHLLAHSPDGTAQNVRNAIVHRLGKLGHVVHTLTAENGKEFAESSAHCHGPAGRSLLCRSILCLATRQQRKRKWTDTPVLATAHRLQHHHRRAACDGSSNASTTDHARDPDSQRPSKFS